MQACHNVSIPCEESNVYFSAGLQVENNIYLIECLSRCLISIHVPSGKSRVEAYLPLEFTEKKIGLLLFKKNIFIYSPVAEQFIVYDCLKRKIITINLQDIEADRAGFYFSNVLIYHDDFIVLPFKGKGINRIGANGILKFRDTQWCSSLAQECSCNESLFGNVRMDSACIVGEWMYFSIVYGKQNYLLRYELNQDEHLCNIVYCSGNIVIRGVYAFSNIILFRRIFSDKTEIVIIDLDSNKQKTITVNCPSAFEEDIYGDILHLRGTFKKEILAFEGKNLKEYRKIYCLKQQDIYISNGILFNEPQNEILVIGVDGIKKYSIEEIVREIENSYFYHEGIRKLFDGKCIEEGRYKLSNLVKYLTELPSLEIEENNFVENKMTGKLIWETIL